MLRTEGLTIRFGGLVALNNVNLDIQRGEIRAIIGPNGAGKSTFFNCVTGVLRPTSGHILLNGADITGLPPNLISRAGVARSYQITNILPNATTLENVRIAAQSRRHGWNMLRHHRSFADIIARPKPCSARSASPARPTSLPPTFHMASNAIWRSASRLRPTGASVPRRADRRYERGRDPRHHPAGHEIAKNLTILIVEHDMPLVMVLADRITVFHYGEVLAEGPPAEIQNNPRVLEVYLKT